MTVHRTATQTGCQEKKLMNIFLKITMLLADNKDAVIYFHILSILTAFREILLSCVQQYLVRYNPQCSIPKLKSQ